MLRTRELQHSENNDKKIITDDFPIGKVHGKMCNKCYDFIRKPLKEITSEYARERLGL